MKLLRSEIGKQSGEIAAIALFGSVANSLLLVVPLYSLQVFDRVLSSGSVETLVMLTLIAVAALGFYGLFEALRSRLLIRCSTALETQLGGRLLTFELAQANRGSQTTGASLRDLREVTSFIGSPNFAALLDIPWAPIFTFVIFMIHPMLGAVALIASVLLIVIGVVSDRTTRDAIDKARGSAMVMSQTTDQFLRNAELLRAMGVAEHAVSRWRSYSDAAIAYFMQSGDRISMLSAVARMLRLGVQVALTGIGILLVLKQDVTSGVVFASTLLLGRALGPLENSITAFKAFAEARNAYRRIDAVLNAIHETDAHPKVELPEPQGHFQLKDVTVHVPGRDVPLLRGISLDLQAGQVLGVVGASGSGKSTLLRYWAGIAVPNSGSIRLDGADLKDWHPAQLGRQIGYLPQDTELLSGTVANNIACLDPQATPESIIAAAKAANLHEAILRLPQGYNTQVGPSGALLSGGQRQRIGLARAFYGNRRILILDEPNAHLDADAERQLASSVLAAKRRGCTVIIATHRTQILDVVDRLAVLENGVLVQYGDARAVIKDMQERARARSTPRRVTPPAPTPPPHESSITSIAPAAALQPAAQVAGQRPALATTTHVAVADPPVDVVATQDDGLRATLQRATQSIPPGPQDSSITSIAFVAGVPTAAQVAAQRSTSATTPHVAVADPPAEAVAMPDDGPQVHRMSSAFDDMRRRERARISQQANIESR